MLQPLPVQEPSFALAPDPGSRLGGLVDKLPDPGTEKSNFRLLESGASALAARLALVNKADKSLDLQYYLIHADNSGAILGAAILNAADRGVRVRILLDDVDTGKHEAAIIGLDAHPNIQIRLFNPFTVRGDNALGRALQFIGDSQLNHRMHNKLFVADNLLAIAGGRNIGDEYFRDDSTVAFHDLDVLAAGEVVQTMSKTFDEYWNSPYAISARAIPKPDKRSRLLAQVRARLDQRMASSSSANTPEFTGLEPGAGSAKNGYSSWFPGRAEFLSDPPEKVEKAVEAADLPMAQILGKGLDVKKDLLIASPYFVPGKTGVDLLSYLRSQDVAVRILTNSVAATDVLVVHAGYAKYRMPLVLQGVELYELKPIPGRKRSFRRLGGSGSKTSLHSKVIVFDRKTVYIGSMNLDPRSLFLNTESGLLIRSPAIADEAARYIEHEMLPSASYRVRIKVDTENKKPELVWQDEGKLLTEEPGMGFWTRFFLKMLSATQFEEWL